MTHEPYAKPMPDVPYYSTQRLEFPTKPVVRPFLPVQNVLSTNVSMKYLFLFRQSNRLLQHPPVKHIHFHIQGLYLSAQQRPRRVPYPDESHAFPVYRNRKSLHSQRLQCLCIPIHPAIFASTGDCCHNKALPQNDCRHTSLPLHVLSVPNL